MGVLMAMKQPKTSHNTLALCDRAAAMLRDAGFELRYVSMKTEACYYGLPGRTSLLRVATHGYGGGGNKRGPTTPVAAKLTFNGCQGDQPGHMRLAEQKFETMVASAIGCYMLATAKERPDSHA